MLADDTEHERVVDFDRGLRCFQKISILVGISIMITAGIVIAFLWNAELATIKFELAKVVAQAILIVLGGGCSIWWRGSIGFVKHTSRRVERSWHPCWTVP